MDRDDIGSDELMGRTTFDLEDRWFDTRWQVTFDDYFTIFAFDSTVSLCRSIVSMISYVHRNARTSFIKTQSVGLKLALLPNA